MHYLQQAFAPEYLSHWVRAFFAIITAAAAVLTLPSINEQVKSGRGAAEAALLNAKALITLERPWLVVQIEKGDSNPTVYRVSAIDRGKTPALLHEGPSSCVVRSIYGFEPPEDFRDPLCAPLDTRSGLLRSVEGSGLRNDPA